MIQFNLLPDIKLEYIKAQRQKRSIVLSSTIVAGVAIGLVVLLGVTVSGFNRHISNLDKDIDDKKNTLAEIEDLDKILTIQSQLNSLPQLHQQKPAVTRFYEFLPRLVPAETANQRIALSDVTVDYENSAIEFSGSANGLVIINKFVDILKFTTFEFPDGTQTNAFKDVVLEFETQTNSTNFDISLSYEPAIFDSQQQIALTVPDIISTRSATEKPNENVFRQQEEPSNQGAQQ